MASGESFDQMLARVQAKRASSTPEGSADMAFPKKAASKGDDASASAPAFVKKGKGKPFGKATPVQKSMRAGRSFRGGGRY